RRRDPAAEITGGVGACVGIIGGTVSFAIFAIVEVALFRSDGRLRAALLEAVQQSLARTPDPKVQEIFAYFKTPEGLSVVMGIGLVLMFLTFLVVSAAGGALGAALLRRKERL